MIRATGKAKRGLGTIRQDLNISVPGGARVEIKGVQDLDLLPEYVENERDRQRTFIELADRLSKAADELPDEPTEVTDVFADTDSSVVRGALDDEGEVWAVGLPGFDGHLGTKQTSEHRLGRELAGYARSQGAQGLFHTDELPAYGITEAEVDAVHEALGTTPGEDAFCLVAADPDVARRSLEAAVDRAEMAFEGVPEETRQALEDGFTRYLRPLPGSARMYPETDVPPVTIEPDHMDRIRADLPELPEQRQTRYREELSLNEEIASALATSEHAPLFDDLVDEGADPSVAASAVLQIRPQVEDEGHTVPDDLLAEAVLAQSEGAFTKDALEDVLLEAAREDLAIQDAVESLGLGGVSEDEAREIVEGIVEDNIEMVEDRGMGAMGALMGQAMGELKGKLEGETVNRLVREAIQERT
jgi:glutamyl-tRNA(Gln) amidotransferase subunit E